MSNFAVTAARRVAWDDDPALPDWPGLPALDRTIAADACVVGLGGSGLAAVEELADRGLTVVGVDAGRVAAGAAGRNGGILSGGGAIPKSGRHSVIPQLRLELYRATMTELERLSEQLGPAVIRPTGSLRIAGLPGEPMNDAEETNRALEFEQLNDEAQTLRDWGVAIEEYDGELGRGFYNPDTAAMNPVYRAFGLASRLKARARLYEHTTVTAVRPGAVETDQGRVEAPIIVIAVDGKLSQILPRLAPLVRTMRLQMIGTAPVRQRRLWCPTSFRCGYDYAQQDAFGRLLVGGGRDRYVEDECTAADEPTDAVQSWIDAVAQRIARRPVTVTHRWAASVTFTDDRRPIVMLVDDGVVACGAYSGSGNLVGPVAARAAVALAVEQTTPPVYFTSSF